MFNYIFIDESGSLGPDSSHNFFIISALIFTSCDELKSSSRIIKKIRQNSLNKKSKKSGEIKFSNSKPLIREKVLTKINNLDVKVYSIVMNRQEFMKQLKQSPMDVYSYLLIKLLKECFSDLKDKKLKIILDRCMNKNQRDKFEALAKVEFLDLFQTLPNVEILHENSESHTGLQLVDFISGCFFHKYNISNLGTDCDKYVDCINNILKLEINNIFNQN